MPLPRNPMVPALLLGLGVWTATADDGVVRITAPEDGAHIAAGEPIELHYEIDRGRQGDHVHVYVDGREIATLHRPQGEYLIKKVAAGEREICIKVVNRAHTPIGLEDCIQVTAE